MPAKVECECHYDILLLSVG